MRVPNFFPSSGLWLGSLNDHIWTLRIRTQTGGAVDSGTGVLTLSDIQLLLECVMVPESEFPQMKKEWATKAWTAAEAQLIKPNQVALVSAGESPKIELSQLKDLEVSSIYFFIHASKSIADSAYFNWLGLQNYSQVHIFDRGGSQLFTSNSEYYGHNSYRAARQLSDSKL